MTDQRLITNRIANREFRNAHFSSQFPLSDNCRRLKRVFRSFAKTSDSEKVPIKDQCRPRRALDHAKSRHHFTLKCGKIARQPPDLENTVKSTFSTIYDSVWRLFIIINNV